MMLPSASARLVGIYRAVLIVIPDIVASELRHPSAPLARGHRCDSYERTISDTSPQCPRSLLTRALRPRLARRLGTR